MPVDTTRPTQCDRQFQPASTRGEAFIGWTNHIAMNSDKRIGPHRQRIDEHMPPTLESLMASTNAPELMRWHCDINIVTEPRKPAWFTIDEA